MQGITHIRRRSKFPSHLFTFGLFRPAIPTAEPKHEADIMNFDLKRGGKNKRERQSEIAPKA